MADCSFRNHRAQAIAFSVMAGLVPAIHGDSNKKGVDARNT
jgi:hypothetical protein